MVREYDCPLCDGSGTVFARDTKAEQACGPYAFRCWCRYGEAKPPSAVPKWQRSLETRYKPIRGVLFESPKMPGEPEQKVPETPVKQPEAKPEVDVGW